MQFNQKMMISMHLDLQKFNLSYLHWTSPVKAQQGPIPTPMNAPKSPRSNARCQYLVANPDNSPEMVTPIAAARAIGLLPYVSPAPERTSNASPIPIKTSICKTKYMNVSELLNFGIAKISLLLQENRLA